MSSLIAFDVARLFLGPFSAMPRGIDRVDLAFARYLFAGDTPQNAVGVLPTPWGIRTYSADRVRRGLHKLESLWAEEIDAAADPVWTHLRGRMLAPGSSEASPSLAQGRRSLSLWRKIMRLGQVLSATGVGLGRPVRSLPPGTPYLNIGQIGLAMPMFFHWLRDRPDVAAVMMLHDVIPIQHPHMVAASSVRDHARMVRTAARFADALIVTTNDAAMGIATELAKCGDRQLPALARALPLAKGFAQGVVAHPDLRDSDYFVVCGTIEPRKNHALLIDVWRKLIERDGLAAPHLIMVGTPGWSANKLFTQLDRSPLLRGRVHHAAGLSTPALAQLIAGSRALLVPSLAEGFSLPLLEAKALGVPVIASDIPVHRERADPDVRLLGAADVSAWLGAIDNTPHDRTIRTSSIAPSFGEAAYCEDVLQFVRIRQAAKLSPPPPDAPPEGDPAAARGALFGNETPLHGTRPDGSREMLECE